FMKRYLVDEGIDDARVEVVDMSMGLVPNDTLAERPIAQRRVIYVGRAVYGKGVQYMLRALTLLGPEYGLTVVGSGFYLDALKHLALRLGVNERVEFPGEVRGDQLRRICEGASVAVVPSIYPEPSGLVVAE